jgi:hypothetical protein
MVVGIRNLIRFNDCLRYSLGPSEKVLLTRYNNPICLLVIIFELVKMIRETNVSINWYNRA